MISSKAGLKFVEAHEAVDIRRLARQGVVALGDERVILAGTVLSVERTRCNRYGGTRPWFLCPICHRRAACLYRTGSVMCRRCSGLQFESQYQSLAERAALRRERARAALRTFLDVSRGSRRLRTRTYLRLVARVEAAERTTMRLLPVEVERMTRRLNERTAR